MLFHCRKAIETASVLWMLWGSLLLSSPVSIYAERVHRDGETSAPGISSGSAINFSLLNGIVRVHARYLNESLQDASERSAHNTGQVKNAGSSSRKKSSAKGSRSQVFEIQFDYGWGNSRGSGRAMDVDTLALDRAAIEYARYLSYVEDAKRIPAGVFRKTQEQAREFTGTLRSQLRNIYKSGQCEELERLGGEGREGGNRIEWDEAAPPGMSHRFGAWFVAGEEEDRPASQWESHQQIRRGGSRESDVVLLCRKF
ncbi:uncharacterized protein LOC124174055 [Ischnura elegans]|uniref:uncharacterized protein LOC124174055 n=1 Tax=Ischnura elegans TaxID=197161 RepID=UPI001ED893D7|nr:uncharacterized protein LOC124174055 [Ischnura elegans]